MTPRQQRTVMALGFFGIGMLLTWATMELAEANEHISTVLLFIWLPVVMAGTQVLPQSITVPYDPVGHPGLYVLAFLINAVLYGVVVFGLWRLAKWARQRLP